MVLYTNVLISKPCVHDVKNRSEISERELTNSIDQLIIRLISRFVVKCD